MGTACRSALTNLVLHPVIGKMGKQLVMFTSPHTLHFTGNIAFV